MVCHDGERAQRREVAEKFSSTKGGQWLKTLRFKCEGE